MEDIKLSFGDIVWCSRESAERTIDSDRHKYGPFIVVEQNDGFIYALYGYGYSSDRKVYKSSFVIDFAKGANNELLRKKTVFNTINIYKISNESIKSFIGKISPYEEECLKRKILINEQHFPGNMDVLNNKLQIEYKTGDVIKVFRESVLILDDTNEKYNIVIPYFHDRETNKTIFKLDHPYNIAKNPTNSTFINHIEPDKLVRILSMYAARKINDELVKTEEVIITPGAVISNSEGMYYVSTIENGNYLCYKLNPSNDEYDIEIYGNKFLIDFNQVKIKTSSKKYFFVHKMNDVEISRIRKLKKEKKSAFKKDKTNNNSNLMRRKSKITFGRLLKTPLMPNVLYAPYRFIDDYYIEVVDLDELRTGKFSTSEFRVDEIRNAGTGHNELIDFISKVDVTIDDDRYLSFLRNNGMYDIEKYVKGFSRSRKFGK